MQNKKFTLISLAVLFLFGGALVLNKFPGILGGSRNYDLSKVKQAEALLTNEIKGGSGLVIVNFWASWCPPCIQETPSMLNFAKMNADKVQLYLVSQDNSSKEIRDFLKAFPDIYSVNLKVIWDANRRIGQNFKVYKLPETFVFDKEGRLVKQLSGAMDWSHPDLQKLINEHSQN